MTKRLAVIDGKSVFYRGYYSMPSLSLPDGTPTGGVYGFVNLAIELIKKLEPDYVAVAWDKRHTNIRKRKEIFSEYKAGRKPAPEDFYAQIPILYELLEAFGWPLYEIDDYEADDIMGAFAREAELKGIETCLLTSDLDALQLIGPMTKVYAIKNGLSNIEEFDIDYFQKKYGINVHQFLDYKSLTGDSSDNLPGVPGVGEKTALKLLQEYGTLDEIYSHLDKLDAKLSSKLQAGKKDAYMTKELARIWIEAPVKLDWEVADVNDTNLEKVAEILKKLQFISLIKRLPKHMQLHSATKESEKLQTEINLLKEVEWPKILQINGPVVIYIENDEIWLSTDKKTIMHNKISDLDRSIWRVLELATVIGYDIKTIYHRLASYKVFVRFSEIHDINQASFLINPLSRDRSLSGLMGIDVPDLPNSQVASIWHIYGQQFDSFVDEPKLAHVARDLDFPLIYILFMMEHQGVKIDPSILEKMSLEFSTEHKKLEKEMFGLVGYEFNIASPQQLSEVLFTKLQLPTEGIKKGKTGYSTGQKELDKLRGQHPIIELIEATRELAKLQNTYVDALPKLVDSNNRIHTTFNQDTTSTGRLSSTNPNLQNIPIRTDLGRRIREAFIPEEGNILVSADYSQFELRLAAILAGDQELINDFNTDIDIHTKTASEVYGIPMQEVTKNQRRNAKIINFGILYGMSPHGLSAATNMSFSEAKKFIDQYFELRKPIHNYIKNILEQARTKGYVETYFGRRRPTPDVLSSNFIVRSAAERAAGNMPIQGTEADLMKMAMIEVDKKMDGLGQQILQIHDSILVECPKENAKKVAKILDSTMENIAPQLGIKLKVDVKIGNNWSEL
ncbi:MAG TPA: DNA polymerase I [Candidatus Saccharibacteria bacterium]|nr:DNA polymerase I [Candidatus Saccharibacteria bacterium]